jgi:DNA-directed RNA polymerase specialized sigma24 family protein
MRPIPLTSEEDELLDILEGRRPPDLERFHSLVALLMERHWYALVTHIDKRCFRVGSSAEDIAVDTFVKAYEFLQQQITRQRDMASNASAMCYSRFQCPHFLGFMKALARWGHLDTARKTRRYRALIDAWERQTWSQTQQRGTWRSHTNGQRIPCLPADGPRPDLSILWKCMRQLPKREHLVLRLYFQHGPHTLTPQVLASLATEAGWIAQEVQTLQRRFRRLLRRQKTETACDLTQDDIAALLDVDRETIRRTLVQGKQHLRAVLDTECVQSEVNRTC